MTHTAETITDNSKAAAHVAWLAAAVALPAASTLAPEGVSAVPGAGTTAPGAAPAGATGPGGAPPVGSSPFQFLFPMLIGLMLVMLLSSILGQRKERKKRESMLAAIKKHDLVQTSGGIIGSVAELRDGEIVLKVDDNSGTRIRFARSAVVTVLSHRGGGGATSASDTEAASPEPVAAGA